MHFLHLRFFAFFVILTVVLSPHTVTAQTPTQTQAPSPTTEPLVPPSKPETGIDLTLSPVFINALTKPGVPTKQRVKIQNNSNIKEYLYVDLAQFKASADGSQPVLSELDSQDEFRSWISFSEKEFTLAPNQTKTITVTITPPKSAGLGYYYALVFKRIQEKDTESSGTTVSGAPAISLLLEVSSTKAKRELQLIDFSTDKLFYEYLPTSFNVALKNTGNIHVVPSGDIFIDWGSKKEITNLPVNDSLGNILPQSKRTYTTTWNDGMITLQATDESNGEKKPKIDFDKPLSSFRIGKYTGHLLLIYDNGDRDVPIEAEVSFWVFPWKIILGALIAIMLPFGISRIIRAIKKKK